MLATLDYIQRRQHQILYAVLEEHTASNVLRSRRADERREETHARCPDESCYGRSAFVTGAEIAHRPRPSRFQACTIVLLFPHAGCGDALERQPEADAIETES